MLMLQTERAAPSEDLIDLPQMALWPSAFCGSGCKKDIELASHKLQGGIRWPGHF